MAKIGFDLALPIGNEVTKKNSIVKPATITKTSNIFDFGAGSVASVNPTKEVSKNIFDYTPTIATPKKTTTKKTYNPIPASLSEFDMMKDPQKYLGIQHEARIGKVNSGGESMVQDAFDNFFRSANDLFKGTKNAYLGPVSQSLGSAGLMSQEKVDKNKKKLQEGYEYDKKFLEERPYLAQREDRKEFDVSKLKDPGQWVNIISTVAGQLAAAVPATVAGSLVGGPVGGVLGMASMYYGPSIMGVYDELVVNGLSEEQAAPISLATALPITAIDVLADRFQLSKIPVMKQLLNSMKKEAIKESVAFTMKTIGKSKQLGQSAAEFIKTVNVEGLTEAIQGIIQNIVVKNFANADTKIAGWDAVNDYVLGVVGSSPFGGIGAVGKYGEITELNKDIGTQQEGRIQVANDAVGATNSYSPFSTITQKYEGLSNAQKISDMENRLQEINTEFPSYDLMPIDIKTEKVAIDMKLNEIKGIQEAKFQTMQEVEVQSTPIDQASEPYQGPKEYTSKLLEDLTGKTTIATQYVKDFLNRSDVKQAEKNVIKDVLSQYEGQNKINVNAFGQALEKRLFKIKANMGNEAYRGYGNSANIFDTHPDVTDYEYDEAVYTMPYSSDKNKSHYSNIKDYFGHVRQYDVEKGGDSVRYIIEKQSDLTQGGKWANLSPELGFKKYKDDLQNEYRKQQEIIKETEKEMSSKNYDLRNQDKKNDKARLEKEKEILGRINDSIENASMEDFINTRNKTTSRNMLSKDDRIVEVKEEIVAAEKTIKDLEDTIQEYFVESEKVRSIMESAFDNYNDMLDPEYTAISERITFKSASERLKSQGVENKSIVDQLANHFGTIGFRSAQTLNGREAERTEYILEKLIDFQTNLERQLQGQKENLQDLKNELQFLESGDYDRMNQDIYDNQSQGHKYILRGEIQRAINDGKKELYLPTGQSIPYYEGWMNAGGIDIEGKSFGDTIEIYGEDYIYLGIDGDGLIEAVRDNEVNTYGVQEFVNGEIENAKDVFINRRSEPDYDVMDALEEAHVDIEELSNTEEAQKYDGDIEQLEKENPEFIEGYVDSVLESHYNNMSDADIEGMLDDQGYAVGRVENGKIVVGYDESPERFDNASGMKPQDANFEDENFQDQVSSQGGVDGLGTAKYYEYVLPKEIKDLSKQYGYTRSKERDSNGLEHYVIDLESISDKRKDKPIPAFQRRSQSKVTPITPTEALSIVREYFDADEVPVEFVNQIVTPEGMQAFGKYYNSMISFASSIDQTTPRHEVFHAYFDMFTSESQKKDVISFTRKTSDYQSRLGDKKDNAYNVEEYLADKFDAYVRENQMPKSMKGKIKDFFDKIIDSVKKLFGKGNKMAEMFGKIVSKNRDYIAQRRMYEPKFMQNFDYDEYMNMDEEGRAEVDKAFNKQMMQEVDTDNPRRQEFIDRIAQLNHEEQRLGYVGKNRIKDPAKRQAQEIKFLTKKENILTDIMEEYNMDQYEAVDQFERFADVPVSQVKRTPRTSTYVTVAEKKRRLMEKVEKTKRPTTKKNSLLKKKMTAEENSASIVESIPMEGEFIFDDIFPKKKEITKKSVAEKLPETKVLYENKENTDTSISQNIYEEGLLDPKDMLKIKKTGFKDLVKDILSPISTELGAIHPRLKLLVRKQYQQAEMAMNKDIAGMEGFLEKKEVIRKNPKDYTKLTLALFNGYTGVAKEILKKYDIAIPRQVLDGIYNRADEVGFDIGYLEDYFPRVIKDSVGLLTAIGKTDLASFVGSAIAEKEQKIGRKLTNEEAAAIANTMLRGYGTSNITIGSKQFKNRTLNPVTVELAKYYHDPFQGLINYVVGVNDAIEMKRMFGGKDVESSIGALTIDLLGEGKVTPEQEMKIRKLLEARFYKGGMNGAMAMFRDLSYITTMGSPISAVTQIGDFARSAYKNGYISTLKNIVSKKNITRDDIGVNSIAREFSDEGKLQKTLNRLFTITGLSWMDGLGKETFINASRDRLTKMASKNEKKLYADLKKKGYIDSEAKTIVQDLKDKNPSDLVKFALFNELADFQPIGPTEVPVGYLSNPNARIMYMLKTFTIKQIDVMRREIYTEMKTNPKQGFKNLLSLSFALMLANASADMLKDLILGRKIVLDDIVLNNLIRLVGFSKYQIYKGKSEGVIPFLQAILLPPTNIVNDPIRDIVKATSTVNGLELKDARTWNNIPRAGKLYYRWFGGGRTSEEKKSGTGKKKKKTSSSSNKSR